MDSNLTKRDGFWIRRDNEQQDLLIVQDIFYADAYKIKIIPGIVQQAQLVIDIGAHIGAFARLIHDMNPACRIICVEACPENISALRANVEEFATVIQAACTYEPGQLMLLNAIRPNCESTGGSTVVAVSGLSNFERQRDYKYW